MLITLVCSGWGGLMLKRGGLMLKRGRVEGMSDADDAFQMPGFIQFMHVSPGSVIHSCRCLLRHCSLVHPQDRRYCTGRASLSHPGSM